MSRYTEIFNAPDNYLDIFNYAIDSTYFMKGNFFRIFIPRFFSNLMKTQFSLLFFIIIEFVFKMPALSVVMLDQGQNGLFLSLLL